LRWTSGGAFGSFEKAPLKGAGNKAKGHLNATSKSYGSRMASASAMCCGLSSRA
jgi:hypothetical protein